MGVFNAQEVPHISHMWNYLILAMVKESMMELDLVSKKPYMESD